MTPWRRGAGRGAQDWEQGGVRLTQPSWANAGSFRLSSSVPSFGWARGGLQTTVFWLFLFSVFFFYQEDDVTEGH